MRFKRAIQILMVLAIVSCLSCNGIQEPVGNNPPTEPSGLFVSYSENENGNRIQLNWRCNDPDGDTVLYDIYFGTNLNPPLVASDLRENFYNPINLVEDSIYYWRVVARDIQGNSASGTINSFKFILAGSGIPTSPYPADGTTGVELFSDLTWQCPSHISDPFLYDVYFGTDSAVELVSAGQAEGEYSTHWAERALMRKTLLQISAGEESYLCCDTHLVAWADESFASADNPYAFSDIGVYINGADVYTYYLEKNGIYSWRATAKANLDDDPDLDIWEIDENGYLVFVHSDISPYYQPNQKYYWRVVTKKQDGQEVSSPIWQFETHLNNPPYSPENPVPGDNETGAGIETVLHWQAFDPDFGMSYVVYDIYFGLDPDPPLAVSNYAIKKYDPRWSFRMEAYNLLLQIYSAQQAYYINNGTYWGAGTVANADAPDGFSPIGIEIPLSSMYTYTIIMANSTDLYVQATASHLDFDAEPDVVDIDRTCDINVLLDDFNNPSYYVDTTYYWKIVSRDNYGAETAGPVWQFKTPVNRAPDLPVNIRPVDGATISSPDVSLGWIGVDEDGDSLSYNIYLGTDSNPQLIAENIIKPVYVASGLQSNQTYYWKIVAEDDHGNQTEGPVWSFTIE